MVREDCFGISENKKNCNVLKQKDFRPECDKCSYYKTKEQYCTSYEKNIAITKEYILKNKEAQPQYDFYLKIKKRIEEEKNI